MAAYAVAPYAFGLCAVFCAAIPFADTPAPAILQPFVVGVALSAALAQFATFACLVVMYRRRGRFSAVVLAGVFLASAVVGASFPAAIPFGRGRDALVLLPPQAAAWLWIAWHIVFLGGALAYACVRRAERARTDAPQRARYVRAAIAAGTAAGLIAFAAALFGGAWLPPLNHGAGLSGYRTSGAGSVILLLCGAAIIALVRLRERTARDGALLLATLAVLLEMWSNLIASERFTVLWYTGRGLVFAASCFVLVAAMRDVLRWGGRSAELRSSLDLHTRTADLHARRLHDLWQTNSAIVDDDQFLSAVIENASQALREGVRFHAFICHRSGGEVVVDVATAAYAGPYVATAGARYPAHDSLLVAIGGESETQAWRDLRADERFSRSARLRNVPWRALVVAPFRVGRTPYYLGFAAPTPLAGDALTPLDRAYAETIAGMCAARLHQRAQVERLRYQSEHDLLTGILNRASLRARGFTAVRAGKRVGLAVVAIDDFRAVNETLGHQTGDAVLVEVAARLARHAGGNDVVARLGGDAFAMLMDGVVSRADAEARVRRYAGAFRDPFGTGDREGTNRVALSASIGAALAPDDAANFEELLAHADAAVYEAKAIGRGRSLFFDGSIETDAHAVRRMKDELAAAIARDELVLYFQPHVELCTGRLAGAEALVRWMHPQRGPLLPAEFVPFAERHGMADRLGAWVMRKTIELSEPWRRADPAFTAWCNISQHELRGTALAARLAAMPRVRGVGVEITESAVLESADEMAAAIGLLRDAGFAIALDDFGTGYSSLAHLRHLPIDVVKIDRSFVAGIPHQVQDVAIVDAVIAIAGRYGFQVVAEGVETMEQLAYLAAGGCTYAQGYAYGRPMPVDAFERWMHERADPLAAAG